MQSKKTKKKRLYEKPRLRTIELTTEEVLGIGCKTSDGSVGMGVNNPICTVGSCVEAGS